MFNPPNHINAPVYVHNRNSWEYSCENNDAFPPINSFIIQWKYVSVQETGRGMDAFDPQTP